MYAERYYPARYWPKAFWPTGVATLAAWCTFEAKVELELGTECGEVTSMTSKAGDITGMTIRRSSNSSELIPSGGEVFCDV